jgi:ribosomal-protein-alanine N-acetyltransferase
MTVMACPSLHSAVFRRMSADDLPAVAAIEQQIYTHPWTPGNFSDSLNSGYECWVMEQEGRLLAYAVVMTAAGEAHLLNISVHADWQRQGLGTAMLHFVCKLAMDYRAPTMFLEVRASNDGARMLYRREGFSEIGLRKGYYPAGAPGQASREDAITMAKPLAEVLAEAGGTP